MVNYYEFIAYMHNSILIVLSDLFSVDFILQMTLMKMANALIYAYVIYRGLRKLKSGAYLASAICLMPTAMFLASTINYDWWVTAFLVYAFSYLISEMQSPEKKITSRDMWLMLGAMFLGCGPKAIYFMLLLPFLLLPKKKFESETQCKKYRRACLILACVILLSFMLPFAIQSDLKTDLRGGSDVSAGGQIKFILTNPLEYTKILLSFLCDYLGLRMALSSCTFFAYLGYPEGVHATVTLLLIALCTFVDRSEHDAFLDQKHFHTVSVLTAFVDIVLIATALYVSFTPVGHSTINGCQWRYLIPVMFPMLYSIGGKMTVRTISKRKLSMIIYPVLAVTLIASIYEVYISALIV